MLAGEVPRACPFEALIAVAWMVSRFKHPRVYFYGWNPDPHPAAQWAAQMWRLFPDPTPGTYHAVSQVDLRRADVRAFTSDRGPPVKVYRCAADTLYIFP